MYFHFKNETLCPVVLLAHSFAINEQHSSVKFPDLRIIIELTLYIH